MFNDPYRQARYQAMLAAGESPVLAEMLASRTFPGIRTGSALMRGVATDDGLGDTDTGDMIRAAADRNGVSRAGKRWIGGLGKSWDDPACWVSDEHDVRAVARERGYAVSGAVNVAGLSEVPDPPPPVVAQDIVDDEIGRRTAIDPGLKERDIRELREEVREDLTLPLASRNPVVPEFARPLITSGDFDVYRGQ
jgi:hypothetical protein